MNLRVIRALIVSLTVALSSLFFRSPIRFKLGQISDVTVTAEREVIVEKSKEEYAEDSMRIVSEIPPVYRFVPFSQKVNRVYDSLVKVINPKRAAELRDKAIAYMQKGVISPKPKGVVVVYENGNFSIIPADVLKSPSEICLENDTLCAFISPTLVSDSSLKKMYSKAVLAERLSKVAYVINPGEVIVSKGQIVDSATYRMLKAYEEATVKPRRLAHAVLSILLALAFLIIFYTRKWDAPSGASVFVFSASHLLELSLHHFFDLPIFFTLAPFVALSVSLLDTPTMALGLALITAVIRGISYDFSLLLPLYIGSMAIVSSFSVKFFKRRSHYFSLFLLIALSGTVSIAISVPFVGELDLLKASLMASVVSLISVSLYALLLPILEAVFRRTTELSYLELASFNHPLLKELSAKAPGTFAHSVIVGNMAEAAARAVGANELIAKLGGYYHDIGKIYNPEYFIENQSGENPHDKLDPVKSAQIIISHVKKGVDLAKKYRLPVEIIDIIRSHHGDTLLWPFYKKAKDLGLVVKEEQFRYPGPRPRTPEEAIVMLADSSEAVSRTAETEEELKESIRAVFEQRLKEGQLDMVPLSRRDLNKIMETFIPIILTFRHQRPKYPSPHE